MHQGKSKLTRNKQVMAGSVLDAFFKICLLIYSYYIITDDDICNDVETSVIVQSLLVSTIINKTIQE